MQPSCFAGDPTKDIDVTSDNGNTSQENSKISSGEEKSSSRVIEERPENYESAIRPKFIIPEGFIERQTTTPKHQEELSIQNGRKTGNIQPSSHPRRQLVGQTVRIAPAPIPVTTIVQDFFRKSAGNKRKTAPPSFLQDPNFSGIRSQNSNTKLRSGKWIPEEEEYAKYLMKLFLQGTPLDCEDGSTLRSYLSRKLRCTPMRISKKFSGKGIGKSCYKRTGRINKQETSELLRLERQFHVATTKFPPGTFAVSLSLSGGSKAAPTQKKEAPLPQPKPVSILDFELGFQAPAIQIPAPTMAPPQFGSHYTTGQLQPQLHSGFQAIAQPMLIQASPFPNPAVNSSLNSIPQMLHCGDTESIAAQINAKSRPSQHQSLESASANITTSTDGFHIGPNPSPFALAQYWYANLGQLAMSAGSMANFTRALLQANITTFAPCTTGAGQSAASKVEPTPTNFAALPRVSLDLNPSQMQTMGICNTEKTHSEIAAGEDLLAAFDQAIENHDKEIAEAATVSGPSTDPLLLLPSTTDDMHRYSGGNYDNNIEEFSDLDAKLFSQSKEEFSPYFSQSTPSRSVLDFSYQIASGNSIEGSEKSCEPPEPKQETQTTLNATQPKTNH